MEIGLSPSDRVPPHEVLNISTPHRSSVIPLEDGHEIFKFLGAALELMEDNFQARGLTTLEGPELCRTNRMIYLFRK